MNLDNCTTGNADIDNAIDRLLALGVIHPYTDYDAVVSEVLDHAADGKPQAALDAAQRAFDMVQ